MTNTRKHAEIESATDSEGDVQSSSKRQRTKASRARRSLHSPPAVLEEYNDCYVRSGAHEVQERARRPWSSAKRNNPSSSNPSHVPGATGNGRDALEQDLNASAALAAESPPGSNVSSPPTLRSKQSSTAGGVQPIVNHIPGPFRQKINRAITLRRTIDEQQGIINTAMATRNKAKKELEQVGNELLDLPDIKPKRK
ncbi:MAG: hypothetical protein Q9176_005907 [Flavoplaca citrina]